MQQDFFVARYGLYECSFVYMSMDILFSLFDKVAYEKHHFKVGTYTNYAIVFDDFYILCCIDIRRIQWVNSKQCNPPIKKAQTKVENSHKLTQGELL